MSNIRKTRTWLLRFNGPMIGVQVHEFRGVSRGEAEAALLRYVEETGRELVGSKDHTRGLRRFNIAHTTYIIGVVKE